MLSIFNLALQLKLCTSSKSQDLKDWTPYFHNLKDWTPYFHKLQRDLYRLTSGRRGPAAEAKTLPTEQLEEDVNNIREFLLTDTLVLEMASLGLKEYLKEERRLREEREREAWLMEEERRLRAILDLDRKKKDFMKQWEARPSLCCPRAAYQWERQAWEKAGFNVKFEEYEAWLNEYEAWLKEEEKKYFVPLPLIGINKSV